MRPHRGSKKPGRPNGLMAGARTVNKLSNSSWFAGSGGPLRNGPSRIKDLSTTFGGTQEACEACPPQGAGQARACQVQAHPYFNEAFIADWKKKTGEKPTINQSHAGSTKQAQAVANGLEADVVTFNQPTDVDFLVKTGGLVAANWREKFPNGASLYTTTSIFLVRKATRRASRTGTISPSPASK